MKLKNVLQGLLREYDLEEISIFGKDKVIFSGSPDAWRETTVDMILYKKAVENAEVTNRMVFNNQKAFIFVAID